MSTGTKANVIPESKGNSGRTEQRNKKSAATKGQNVPSAPPQANLKPSANTNTSQTAPKTSKPTKK